MNYHTSDSDFAISDFGSGLAIRHRRLPAYQSRLVSVVLRIPTLQLLFEFRIGFTPEERQVLNRREAVGVSSIRRLLILLSFILLTTLAMFSQLRKRDKHRCRGRGKLRTVAAKMAGVSNLQAIEFDPLRVNV
jgi:hypothetical protein